MSQQCYFNKLTRGTHKPATTFTNKAYNDSSLRDILTNTTYAMEFHQHIYIERT